MVPSEPARCEYSPIGAELGGACGIESHRVSYGLGGTGVPELQGGNTDPLMLSTATSLPSRLNPMVLTIPSALIGSPIGLPVSASQSRIIPLVPRLAGLASGRPRLN